MSPYNLGRIESQALSSAITGPISIFTTSCLEHLANCVRSGVQDGYSTQKGH